MPKVGKPVECPDPTQRGDLEVSDLVSRNHDHKPLEDFPITGSRRSIARVVRSLSILINANDSAIDELFSMIENWENYTGHPFYTNQFINKRGRLAGASVPPPKLVVSQGHEPKDLLADEAFLIKRAETIIKERHLQIRDMPRKLKGDQYIRILLVLLIEAYSEKNVPLTSIGYAIDCPQTTVIRYLQQLEELDLISRESLASDGRVTLIELTEKGGELARKLVGRTIERASVT